MRTLALCSLIALGGCDDASDTPDVEPADAARVADSHLDLGSLDASPDAALVDRGAPPDPDAAGRLDATPAMDAAANPDAALDAAPLPDAVPSDMGVAPLPLCPSGFGVGEVDRDIVYAEHERQRIDLYRTDAPGPAPLFIWIHGGAWRAGSWRAVNPAFLALRERGWSVASVGYRLSDAPWPAPVSDVKAAIRHLRANAAEYGVDPGRFVVSGASAGGHLVAMLGVSPGDAALNGVTPGNAAASEAVQAVVDFYGPAELATMDIDTAANDCGPNRPCHDCEGSPEALLIDCVPSACPEVAAEASPVTYASADAPPFLIIHGTRDCTVPTPQSRRLFDALDAAGASVELIEVDGAGHALGEVLTAANLDRMIAFIDETVRGCRSAESPAPPDEPLPACHHENCPDEAAACESDPACVALDACFQACLGEGRMQCARECLAEPGAMAAGALHRPLYDCARAARCY